MRPTFALIVAAAVLAPAALADISVTLDLSSARPGERVRANSATCCFLSLYLVPARLVPAPKPCRTRTGARAICAPTSLGPPRRPGWTWLGRFFPTRGSFHFRVPRVGPGLYRPVVYCPPCTRGPRGSLIAGRLFRIR